MSTVLVSKGGQISIPAAIRRRWGATRLHLEDRGDEIVLRPLPADPVRAAVGSLPLPRGVTADSIRASERRSDARRERRRS